jgi:DNA-binding transcriptional ArsR family regulator
MRLEKAAPLFAALGDATRLKLVAHLSASGPRSIAQLQEVARSISRQAVTKHLRALEHAGVAHSAHIGRETIWELQPKRLDDVHRYLEQISRDWDAALARLAALVERE